MSETFDVDWSGDSPTEMVNELAELEAVLIEYLNEAMETAVLLIESTAKQMVAVDTGRLRASIASEVRKIANDTVVGYVGTNVEYAPYQEYGTSKMDAQPYLRPAIEQHRDDVRRLLREAVNDAVDQVS